MFSILKKIYQSKSLYDFIALAIIQGGNFLLPVITFPYISRIIGAEKFGVISFASAYVMYFAVLINYGFDFTATRSIAVLQEDNQKRIEIFSAVFGVKVLLSLVSLFVFILSLFVVDKFSQNKEILLFTFPMIIGQWLLSSWYYQGIGKLTVISTINFGVKLISTALVFILITQETDYLKVVILTTSGSVVAGLVGIGLLFGQHEVRLVKVSLRFITDQLKIGLPFFLSTVFINLYTWTNTVILGFFAPDWEVGYFSAGFKLISIITSVVMLPLNLTIFPKLAHLFATNTLQAVMKIRQINRLLALLMLLTGIFTYLFAEPIIIICFGNSFQQAGAVLKILAPLPLIIGVSNLICLQGMLNLQMDKTLLYIVGMGACICLALNGWLAPSYHAIGTSWAWLITEIWIVAASYIAVWKKKGFSLI